MAGATCTPDTATVTFSASAVRPIVPKTATVTFSASILGAWFTKLAVESPLAYLLEVHAIGDSLDTRPTSVLQKAYDICWVDSINGIDTLVFRYPLDDSKIDDVDTDHEVWIRRYDTSQVIQRFILEYIRDIREGEIKVVEVTMSSLAVLLMRTECSVESKAGTDFRAIIRAMLAEQSGSNQITLGTVDDDMLVLPTTLTESEDTIWKAMLKLKESHGGYLTVDIYRKLNWIAEPNHSDPYPQLYYRRTIIGFERELDYTESTTPDKAYQIDVVALSEIEKGRLGDDVLYAGQKVTIYDDDFSINEDLRIIKVTHNDLLKPYDIGVMVNAKLQDITDLLANLTDETDTLGNTIVIELAESVVSIGRLIVLTSNGWVLADKTDEDKTSKELAFALEAGGIGDLILATREGDIPYDTGEPIGSPLYVGEGGEATGTIPGSGEYGRVIGRAGDGIIKAGISPDWVKLA